ncbi:MAG TPA: M14 family metallopeptidase [Nakamurella sp.]|nr:M14 family metallopeptidase [Nakamurella sp.]
MDGELPQITRLAGRTAGPTLALLGGVHGDETEGVLAARTVADRLADRQFRGTLVWAAPAHPAAWAADSRIGPADGANLARVFPGRADGSPTEQVAAHLTAGLIAGADLLIDLHSAGRGFDMPLLAGYHSAGPLCGRAEAAARAFAAPLLWQHPGGSSGRSLSAASAMGIPSLYVEGRGGGRVRQRDLDCYVNGVLRVLVHLGMLDPDQVDLPAPDPVTVVAGDGNTDEGITAPAAGFFVTATEAGAAIGAGATIGTVVDVDGRALARITAPVDGVVMLLRRSARVQQGDTLAIVGEIAAHPAGSGTGPGAVGSGTELGVVGSGAGPGAADGAAGRDAAGVR